MIRRCKPVISHSPEVASSAALIKCLSVF